MSKWASTAVVVAVTIVVAAVIYLLADQNRQLKAALSGHGGSAPEASALRKGDTLPPSRMVNILGRESTLAALVSHGGVIAFFTTNCPHCESTLPAWDRLSADLERNGYPFIGVSLSNQADTEEYVTTQAIRWPVWLIGDQQARGELRVRAVPLTAIISPTGEVVRAWSGALEKERLTSLMAVVRDQLDPGQARRQSGVDSVHW